MGRTERMREDRDRPLRSLALSAEQDVRTKFAWLCAGMRHHAQEMQNNVGRIVQQMGQHIATQQRQQQGSLSRLASLTATRRKCNPLFDLSFNPVDIKNRLTGVTVYTVANNETGEFVLASGRREGQEEARHLGLFFFKEDDAAAMVATIKEQTPELGKVTQVMKLSLDKAYDYALDPQLAEMRKGVTIRFMPDAQQVKHALEMYESEDVDANAFTGVPVFQAEGLIVKTDKAKYTPLFFNKEDLDAAVGNAYTERESHREATNKAHSSRAKADLEAAQKKFDSAEQDGKEEAKASLDKAQAKSDMYKGRAEEADKKSTPKVEVGCLEEVILKLLEAKGEGEWGSVMFVPAGAISKQSKK